MSDDPTITVMRIEWTLGITAKCGDDYLKACLTIEGIPVGDAQTCIKSMARDVLDEVLDKLNAERKMLAERFGAPEQTRTPAQPPQPSPEAAKPIPPPAAKPQERVCEKCKKPLKPEQPQSHMVCLDCYKKSRKV